jgi:hypothetical protein
MADKGETNEQAHNNTLFFVAKALSLFVFILPAIH